MSDAAIFLGPDLRHSVLANAWADRYHNGTIMAHSS